MKQVIFYFKWYPKETPVWGEWLYSWRNSSFSLQIISEQVPDPPFDLFQPLIEWKREIPSGDYCFELPTLDLSPNLYSFSFPEQPFCISVELGSYVGFLFPDNYQTEIIKDIIPLKLENKKPHWENLWNTFYKRPSLTKTEARLFCKICIEQGEWKTLGSILDFCHYPEETLRFYQALVAWGNSRSDPCRNDKLWEKIKTNMWEESFLWMLKLWDSNKNDLQMDIIYQIFNLETSLTPNVFWTELFSDDYITKCLQHIPKKTKKIKHKLWELSLHLQKEYSIQQTLDHWDSFSLKNIPFCQKGFLYKGNLPEDFVTSSCGLIPYIYNPDFYLVNMRSVNYRIQEDGSYKSFLGGKECFPYNGITENYMFLMDREKLTPVESTWKKINNHLIPNRNEHEKAIVGVEDIRLYENQGESWFYGITKEFSYNENIRILYGKYNLEKHQLESTFCIHPPEETTCEKNWTWLPPSFFIYQWYPLQIGTIKNQKLEIQHILPTPSLFEGMRGSTPCLRWKNLFWTITHKVLFKNGKRTYIHFLVVLSSNDFSLVGVSQPFVFEDNQIEYCVGFDIWKNHFLFLYSVMDRTSQYSRIPIDKILDLMVWIQPNSWFKEE